MTLKHIHRFNKLVFLMFFTIILKFDCILNLYLNASSNVASSKSLSIEMTISGLIPNSVS